MISRFGTESVKMASLLIEFAHHSSEQA